MFGSETQTSPASKETAWKCRGGIEVICVIMAQSIWQGIVAEPLAGMVMGMIKMFAEKATSKKMPGRGSLTPLTGSRSRKPNCPGSPETVKRTVSFRA